MAEGFTQRARHVITLAREEAERLNHGMVGTEHILLAIIREGEGGAGNVLESLDINPERVRAEIESTIGMGERIPYQEVPFTPQAKKVLELALDEARRLGHNYISTEHLLLGLIREGEGVAAHVLKAMGADLERTRAQVPRLLGEPTLKPEDRPPALLRLVDRIASLVLPEVLQARISGRGLLHTWTKVLLVLWTIIAIQSGTLLIFFPSFAASLIWPAPSEPTSPFTAQLHGVISLGTGIASLVALIQNRWSIARPVVALYAAYGIAVAYLASRWDSGGPVSLRAWVYIIMGVFFFTGSFFVWWRQSVVFLDIKTFPPLENPFEAWNKLIIHQSKIQIVAMVKARPATVPFWTLKTIDQWIKKSRRDMPGNLEDQRAAVKELVSEGVLKHRERESTKGPAQEYYLDEDMAQKLGYLK
jgi:ClpA/ClpB-like protein